MTSIQKPWILKPHCCAVLAGGIRFMSYPVLLYASQLTMLPKWLRSWGSLWMMGRKWFRSLFQLENKFRIGKSPPAWDGNLDKSVCSNEIIFFQLVGVGHSFYLKEVPTKTHPAGPWDLEPKMQTRPLFFQMPSHTAACEICRTRTSAQRGSLLGNTVLTKTRACPDQTRERSGFRSIQSIRIHYEIHQQSWLSNAR